MPKVGYRTYSTYTVTVVVLNKELGDFGNHIPIQESKADYPGCLKLRDCLKI